MKLVSILCLFAITSSTAFAKITPKIINVPKAPQYSCFMSFEGDTVTGEDSSSEKKTLAAGDAIEIKAMGFQLNALLEQVCSYEGDCKNEYRLNTTISTHVGTVGVVATQSESTLTVPASARLPLIIGEIAATAYCTKL